MKPFGKRKKKENQVARRILSSAGPGREEKQQNLVGQSSSLGSNSHSLSAGGSDTCREVHVRCIYYRMDLPPI